MEAASVPWRPLGELFVSRGLISEEELEKALAEQAATGKRLGEILVDRGLVSSPDLTSALMDQLGVEISKEEGFGSGLWAEIKRRHRRALPADGDESHEAEPVALVPPAVEPQVVEEAFVPTVAAPPEPEPVAAPQPAPVIAQPEPQPPAVSPQLEQELEEIKADYQPPAEREPEPEPEPEPLPPAAVAEPEPEPAPEPAIEPEPEPEPVAEADDTAALRAELQAARTDLAHLNEMLADAMTALAALTAEAAGETYGD